MAEANMDVYAHESSTIFYTDTNIPGSGFDPALLDQSLCVKCTCSLVCGEGCVCVAFSGAQTNYDKSLLITREKLTSNSFILECNEFCECSATCGNRLVQFGPRENLSVFSTDLRGLGLKTNTFVRSGSFICEYAGEVIGREEAKRRARRDCVNYIFVLREHSSVSVTETIVDPTSIGNIGRYINHSCHPNAAIVPVRVDSPVPRLAVFAVEDILAGEEITYDYSSGGSGLGTNPCHCGTRQCRKFLPFDKNLLG